MAIDGSLINAVLSMAWADYRKGVKQVKVHLGFDLNHAIPGKIFFTDGKGDERPFLISGSRAGEMATKGGR